MVDYMAALVDIIYSLHPIAAASAIWPLLLLVTAILVYFVLTSAFYDFISKKDPFKLVEDPTRPIEHAAAILEYLFLFPLVTFTWFAVLSGIITTLRGNLPLIDIFLISAGVTVAMRIMSYVDERLSRQIAKLIPLTFISVALMDYGNVSLHAPFTIFYSLPSYAGTLVYYFLFIFVVE